MNVLSSDDESGSVLDPSIPVVVVAVPTEIPTVVTAGGA